VAAHGAQVDLPLARRHGLQRAFPAPDVVAKVPPESLPMPRSRARALATLGQAVDAGDMVLDPGADRDEARASLLALPGVGPWTADYVLMRALSHPDVLLTTDLVLRRELERRGLGSDQTDRWRPWRSYAGMHLWRAAASPVPERKRP
jgi:AraC family transcriptional regulator of adaptative response / DNA-3-methyladenine glycosylase II